MSRCRSEEGGKAKSCRWSGTNNGYMYAHESMGMLVHNGLWPVSRPAKLGADSFMQVRGSETKYEMSRDADNIEDKHCVMYLCVSSRQTGFEKSMCEFESSSGCELGSHRGHNNGIHDSCALLPARRFSCIYPAVVALRENTSLDSTPRPCIICPRSQKKKTILAKSWLLYAEEN